MERIKFNSLFLNIGDEIKVTMNNLFWAIKDGKIIDEYDKKREKGWNHAPVLTGTYCGENYKQGGELNVVKLRVLDPFVMSKEYGNYIRLVPSRIISIEINKKVEASVLDKVSHALTLAET